MQAYYNFERRHTGEKQKKKLFVTTSDENTSNEKKYHTINLYAVENHKKKKVQNECNEYFCA